MAELPFDPEEIEELALRLNAVVAREGEDIPDPGGNASDDEIPEMLQEHEDDPDRIELADEIDGMDVEQQEALVALFWIGHGDGARGLDAGDDLVEMLLQHRKQQRLLVREILYTSCPPRHRPSRPPAPW